MPRSAVKKHDGAAEARTRMVRRQRTTTQIRKDKRQETVQTKRRRLMSVEQPVRTDRSIVELVHRLGHSSAAASFETLKEIRMLLSRHENDYELVEQIIESGIVPILVSRLHSALPLGHDVYHELLWCLTNIASGHYEHTKLVLPAVPRLLHFVTGSSPSLAASAAWVLGNLAADGREFRQHLVANGAVGPLVKLLDHPREDKVAKTSAWALANLARGNEASAKPFVDAGIVAIVCQGLGHPRSSATFSDAVVVEVAWLVSYLTAREETYLQVMVAAGLVDVLVPYFATTRHELLTPLLRIVGNLCCGPHHRATSTWHLPSVRRLLQADSGVLPILSACLQPGTLHASLAPEAAWVVANVAATEAMAVECLLHAQLLPLLGHQFHAGSYDVRREVAFALTNIALASAAHLAQVLRLDVVKGFLHLLTVADVATVGNSLRFIEQVLRRASRGVAVIEENEGIDALETVQFACGHEQLATWAAALVNEFYGENYGIPSSPSVAGSNFSSEQLQGEASEPQASLALGGRGRGAHMTTPAWKT